MLLVDVHKKEIPEKVDAYALNTPLFLSELELEDTLFLKDDSFFEEQEDEFV